ncbi:MAG: transcriptional regulator [Candidatus Marinimicrobia bacterium CG08_land_8_20_14_0_20_45_22]|nr:MAG: transcriptional regulator [Candidatus Marinimicrobia bacterium CG08_land_8_20_14_0_20_45_22]
MNENQYIEKKSLCLFTNNNPDWKSLARGCVSFANARGGLIAIGIENHEEYPPAKQQIPEQLAETIRRRISELTINVGVDISVKIAPNDSEFIEIKILPNLSSIASTTDGQYYIRIADHCKPVLPDELQRLFNDKPAYNWETRVVQKVTIEECSQIKLQQFIDGIKNSGRVSDFIKVKSKEEILFYYLMYDGTYLTNLGILWIGKREQRARLMYAPAVQFIKYDENGNKVKKELWDDFSQNPIELIQSVWEKIPEWKEGVEISEGIFGRKMIFHYNENVIRELLANALVHRPYTTRGDIFINLFYDRVEFHNPGLLPMGVTPSNILHQSVKRNEHLSKIFYDLNLMEREGSGYDKMYEIQLSESKNPPVVEEGDDRVQVTIYKQIKNPEVISLVEKLKSQYYLSQKEIICLGIIAQHRSIIATEFSKQIQSSNDKQIKNWLGKLLGSKIILTKGKTKGTQYYINPSILRGTALEKTNLRQIEGHRLKQLIIEGINKYPCGLIEEIHNRIGEEIPIRKLRITLYSLVKTGELQTTGGKKYRKYFIDKNQG